MMTFKQWMKQTMRQYGRHYVVALFACCFLLPLLTGDQGMLWNTRRDVLLIGSGFTAAVAVFQFRFLCQRNAAIRSCSSMPHSACFAAILGSFCRRWPCCIRR